MGGGAWPFLVGGVICLVNSVNERDLNLLNSYANFIGEVFFFSERKRGRFFLVCGQLLRGTISV
jgi:hypothetical protein